LKQDSAPPIKFLGEFRRIDFGHLQDGDADANDEEAHDERNNGRDRRRQALE
jgi:hypothetical protein